MAAQVERDADAGRSGPARRRSQVNADLNANQADLPTRWPTRARACRCQQHTETETLTGAGRRRRRGTAGTTANIPTYAQAGGGGNSNYSHKITDTTYGVNKTVTHTMIAPGAINRQTVSVLVDSSVPASAIPALQAAVASAVGLVPSRGDTLSFGQITFAKPPDGRRDPDAEDHPSGTPSTRARRRSPRSLFLFFVSRMLRRREREALAGEPTWLRELETPAHARRARGARGRRAADRR